MALPRCLTVDPTVSCLYHCWSRCTRTLGLLGRADRRDALVARLELLACVFAVEVCEFTVMDNHFHAILRTFPELAWAWTDEEVAARWLTLLGRALDKHGNPNEKAVAAILADPARIDELRRRLADLGWFHKELKEHLARAWNKEDSVTGHFWEGRYGAEIARGDVSLVNQAIYVLLNRIRCGAEGEVGQTEATSIGRRVARLVAEIRAGEHADALAAFEDRFERSDWTPVFPCDPGSVRDMDHGTFARRVARGRQRSAIRSALADRGMATVHASVDLPVEEIAPHVVPGDGPAPGRPSPVWPRGARRRPSIGAREGPRASEGAWLTAMENPFARTRVAGGAVAVLRGMTLAALVEATDEEGRLAREDKPGRIAPGTPKALEAFRSMVLAATRRDAEAEPAPVVSAAPPAAVAPTGGDARRPRRSQVGEVTRALLRSVRALAATQCERIARVFATADEREGGLGPELWRAVRRAIRAASPPD